MKCLNLFIEPLKNKRSAGRREARLIFLSVCCCFVVVCCADSEGDSEFDKKIWLQSPPALELSAVGDRQEVKFNAQRSWTVTSNVLWITFLSPSEGKGHASVLIDVARNTQSTIRKGQVIVQVGEVREVIEISQRALFTHVGKHPSILYTAEELLMLKELIASGRSESISNTYQGLMARCDTAMACIASPYIGTVPLDFITASYTDASFSRDLAMAYWFTGDKAYAEKSVELIREWAVKTKDNRYESRTGSGMYIARALYPMVCAYDLLMNEKVMDEETKSLIIGWFETLQPECLESIRIWEENDYFNKQYYQNHLVAHTMGLMMLGFITDDASLVQYALDSSENPRDFYDFLTGSIFMEGDIPYQHMLEQNNLPPATGEVYDRYRHNDPNKGIQYAHLTQSLLATLARMCANNGLDLFVYTSPSGENLRYTYEYYSDFYRLKDACIKSGYYCGETPRIGIAGDSPCTYELGFRYYSGSDPIKALINSGVFNRESGYYLSFGFTRFFSAFVDN